MLKVNEIESIKGTRRETSAIGGNYEKLPNGNYRNILTRQETQQPIDIGHSYGWEHRRLSQLIFYGEQWKLSYQAAVR